MKAKREFKCVLALLTLVAFYALADDGSDNLYGNLHLEPSANGVGSHDSHLYYNASTSTLILHYFNIAGKGDAVRLALNHAGIHFLDHRLHPYSEWLKLKQSGALIFGQVPALEIIRDDGASVMLTGSCAILRWIATGGVVGIPGAPELYAKCPIMRNKIDAIMTHCADTFQAFVCFEDRHCRLVSVNLTRQPAQDFLKRIPMYICP